MIVGAMYCKKPTIDNGTRWAPLANNSSGIAVITPAPINSHVTSGEMVSDPPPLQCVFAKNNKAMGVTIIVSIVRPNIALSLTVFFNNPYIPKLKAKKIATHGT